MSFKRWIFLLLLSTFVFGALIVKYNYSTDPYGYNSREDKFVRNLSEISNPNILINRITSDGEYYIIGTSRMVRVNPKIIENLTNKKAHNIHIDGSTLKENHLLAKVVKEHKKNFIYGFDAVSLNKGRLIHPEIQQRFNSLQKGLESNTNILKKYFSLDLLVASIRHSKDIKRDKKFDQKYIDENNINYTYLYQDVVKEQGYDNSKNRTTGFSNFDGYSKETIINLAKLGTKDDIFVIYPKHYYNYLAFSQYQDINEKYLASIKLLVENTDAKVYSFYQVNELTKNPKNFDAYGWHFKPKLSEQLLQQVFNYNEQNKTGILLTSNNIDSYIKELKKQLKSEYMKVLEDKK